MNTIISIGYLGIQKCYLNISEDDAINRYCKDENLSLKEFNDNDIQINIIKFNDEFAAYTIWEK